jgi:hypothetical protein
MSSDRGATQECETMAAPQEMAGPGERGADRR